MRIPHRDDPATAVSRRLYDDDHPPVQEAQGEEAILAPAVRANGQSRAGKDLPGHRHIQPAVIERGLALGRIEGDLPSDFCYYKNNRRAMLL
jgi:hypothetical protein